MSKEYIEKKAFIEAKRKQYCTDCDRMVFCYEYEIDEAPCCACYIDDLLTDVEDFPAADVVEVRHGRWVEFETDAPPRRNRCSECGYITNPWLAHVYNYCSNCGAKMDGGVNDAAD